MEGKPYSRNTVRATSFRAGEIFFFWFPSKKAVFHYSGLVFKPANEALHPSLKDHARQGLNCFTKHKRPISSKDLEDLYAANQLGLNVPESTFGILVLSARARYMTWHDVACDSRAQ